MVFKNGNVYGKLVRFYRKGGKYKIWNRFIITGMKPVRWNEKAKDLRIKGIFGVKC